MSTWNVREIESYATFGEKLVNESDSDVRINGFWFTLSESIGLTRLNSN